MKFSIKSIGPGDFIEIYASSTESGLITDGEAADIAASLLSAASELLFNIGFSQRIIDDIDEISEQIKDATKI